MRVLIAFAALLALAYAAPALETRQQGKNCKEVFFPEQCSGGQVMCDGAGAIEICCDYCY